MEFTNKNCTCSDEVHRFILEKINPWIQCVNWKWIRCTEGVFRKSFDRLTNFQFTSCIHRSLQSIQLKLLLLCYFYYYFYGQNIGIDIDIVCFNQRHQTICSTLENFPLTTKFIILWVEVIFRIISHFFCSSCRVIRSLCSQVNQSLNFSGFITPASRREPLWRFFFWST